jgi:dCMP deaminase
MRRDKAIQYFRLARFLADQFSKDPSTKVGAILLAPESLQVLSLGYNGMPRGIQEDKPERWERPLKYQFVEHAERNSLYNACRHGTPVENSILVVTMFPCTDCTRAVIQSGVKTVVTLSPNMDCERWGAQFRTSIEMFEEVGMELVLLEATEVS